MDLQAVFASHSCLQLSNVWPFTPGPKLCPVMDPVITSVHVQRLAVAPSPDEVLAWSRKSTTYNRINERCIKQHQENHIEDLHDNVAS